MSKHKITIGNLEDYTRMLFPQEREMTPRLRFEGFDGEWKKLRIGDCGSWSKGKLLSKQDLVETGKYKCIHYGELFVLYGEVISNVISRTNLNTGCFSKEGDILFPDSDVTPTGLARCSSIMENAVVLGGGILIFHPFDDFYSPFLSYSINNEKNQIISRVTGTTVRHINSKALSEVEIVVPVEYEEQKRIASFLQSLDEQIALQQQQLERLKQMKQACLGSLFPDNQAFTPPRLRFKGFEGQWIMVKFSDMVHRISTNDITNELPGVEFEDIVAGEGVLNKDIYRKNVIKRGIRFDEHDVLFGKLRPYLKNILFAEFKGVAIGDFWVLRATELVDPYFLYILVSSENFMKVANVSSGSKMPRADWNLVSNSYFLIPSSIEEQHRIGSFFHTLDKKILVQSHQVEKLKQLKKTCLNKIIA